MSLVVVMLIIMDVPCLTTTATTATLELALNSLMSLHSSLTCDPLIYVNRCCSYCFLC